jgi:hypothetical protein
MYWNSKQQAAGFVAAEKQTTAATRIIEAAAPEQRKENLSADPS